MLHPRERRVDLALGFRCVAMRPWQPLQPSVVPHEAAPAGLPLVATVTPVLWQYMHTVMVSLCRSIPTNQVFIFLDMRNSMLGVKEPQHLLGGSITASARPYMVSHWLNCSW